MELKIDKQLVDDAVQQAVKEIKEQFIWIPKDGLTNGEVIQALFPNCVVDIDEDGWFMTNLDGYSSYTPEWWNAPYKAEKGGE